MQQRRDYSNKNHSHSEWLNSYFEEPEDSSFLASPTNWICQYLSPNSKNYHKSTATTTNSSNSIQSEEYPYPYNNNNNNTNNNKNLQKFNEQKDRKSNTTLTLNSYYSRTTADNHNNNNTIDTANNFFQLSIPSSSSSRIIAPNVSKLSSNSLVEIILKSSDEEVSILCSVDVLKMRSLYFQELLLEQEQTIISSSTSDSMWRAPLYVVESSPYEAAAFLESIHEGKGFYSESWNLSWARLSIAWKIKDITEEYSLFIQKHIKNLFSIIEKNHWRVNSNYFVGSKIAIFRKSNGPLPTMLVGYVVEGSSSTPYSQLRVSFEIDSINKYRSTSSPSWFRNNSLDENYVQQESRQNSNNDDNRSTQSDELSLNYLQNNNNNQLKSKTKTKNNIDILNWTSKGTNQTKIPQRITSLSSLASINRRNSNHLNENENGIETQSENGTGILEIKSSPQTQPVPRVLTLKEIRDSRNLFREKQRTENQMNSQSSYSYSYSPSSSQESNIQSNPIGEVSEPFWIQSNVDQQWKEADEICEQNLKKMITDDDKRIFWEMISIIMNNSSIFQTNQRDKRDQSLQGYQNNHQQSNENNDNFDFDSEVNNEGFLIPEDNIIKDINDSHKFAKLIQKKEYRILWILTAIDSLPNESLVDLIKDVFITN